MLTENVALRNGFGPKLWSKMQTLMDSSPSRIYGNPTAWWNGMLSIEFLRFHFGSREDMSKRILMVWDSFSGHFTAGVVAYAESINVELIKVPPSFTFVCQPADVAWMRPLKSRLRQRWTKHISECLCSYVPGVSKPASLRPSRGDIVAWVDEAWADIPRSTIVSGFTKCKLVSPAVSTSSTDALLIESDVDMDDALFAALVELDLVEIVEV
ncbi:hypothetical protein DYB26_012140 [Aphanomyces astaci]|nr:hypothetical protein DYB26_012140 [Aphanomyces astaci]RHZ01930.1 hypothetical protein DYB31_015973 [Aphanomyces astaci]